MPPCPCSAALRDVTQFVPCCRARCLRRPISSTRQTTAPPAPGIQPLSAAADGLGGYAVLAGLAAVGASLAPVIRPILEVSVPPQRSKSISPHPYSSPAQEANTSAGSQPRGGASDPMSTDTVRVLHCCVSFTESLPQRPALRHPTPFQVRALSKLPADEIEAAAAVPEPLQNADGSGAVKLWGEDALLDWPGAMGPGELLPASS